MATTEMDYENANGNQFDDEAPRYDRRSASPRREDDPEPARRRSASPNGNDRAAPKEDHHHNKDDDGAINPGSNLFVTGIHPRLSEDEVTRLFEKYGDVEKCQIMKDPHSGESRGFGFVKMVTSDQADAAKEGLQGENIEGRTLSIEKARRSRPRTPTPGKYFGPPKRDGPGGGPGGGGGGGGGRGRYDDRRRGGYGGGYGGRDDYRGYRGRDDRGGDRGYDRGYDRGGYDRGYREDRGYDRGYREDRGYDRRGGGSGGGSGSGGGGGGGGGGDRDDYSRGDRYGGSASASGGGGGGGGGREDRAERYGGGRGGRDDRGSGYDRDRYADRDARPRDGPPGGYSGSGESGARSGEGYGAR